LSISSFIGPPGFDARQDGHPERRRSGLDKVSWPGRIRRNRILVKRSTIRNSRLKTVDKTFGPESADAVSDPGTDLDAAAVLERLRRAETALAPLVVSDVPFVRNGVMLVLVQLRELQAFIDVDAAAPDAGELA
jgi:hypothetical protein